MQPIYIAQKTNLPESLKKIYYPVPADPNENDFVMSFTVNQVAEYKQFFNDFGFVVIRDILTTGDCNATIDDIWNYLENKRWVNPKYLTPEFLVEGKINRNDPQTWINKYWPNMMEEGILGSPPVFTKQALQNRQNPKLYSVFSEIMGKKELLINHDRYGLFRPTKDVSFHDNKGELYKQDKPEWKTFKNIHIDMNPWQYYSNEPIDKEKIYLDKLRYRATADFITENNYIGNYTMNETHLQGLINLLDNRVDDGGFHLVPGFYKHMPEWVKSTETTLKKRYGTVNTFIVLPDSEPMQQLATRISMKAGSLLVWEQKTPHGSAPNNSSNMRMAQFLKFLPAISRTSERALARSAFLKQKVQETGVEMTDLGEKLFGFNDF